ncbi:hypothetical protein TSUD_300940 [Trifolium subterraneum]|uniref:Photosystem II core complex proteins psbY n=1 Tax=Trifolium subterraneum TaxID=3900 RepID=A0A2Z6PG78_TRISU|nr:hypothetical protein TSUD_300940 [Trifolium subterraneum]
MAATMAMMINSKCLNTSLPKLQNPTTKLTTTTTCKITTTQNQPKGLISVENTKYVSPSLAIAGAIFSSLATSDAAFAAQQIAEIAEGDNRGIALLLPLIPAIAWVLFNILQPALNQINRMRSTRGVIVGLGLGLGGLAASGMMSEASASEIGLIADAAAAGSDNRGTLLLFVVAPAILWVLYNILQPALNQINRMRN